jgi:chromosome transmission fidelity protein 1
MIDDHGRNGESSKHITLSLPDSHIAQNGHLNEENERLSSRAFHFPYPKAYSIQLDLMRAVYTAIEDGKVGIFESPTGTGKSLSLICGACSWLEANAKRHEQGQLKINADNDEEPDWVREHERNRQIEALQRHEKDLKNRIEAARIRLRERRKSSANSIKRTKVSQTKISNSDSEDDYLVGENDEHITSYSNSAIRPDDSSSFLSPAVRALMEKSGSYMGNSKGRKIPFYAKHAHDKDEEEEPETMPKIIYVSRTHSQVSQFINEVKRTDFAGVDFAVQDVRQVAGKDQFNGAAPRFSVRNISLGSRKQMCINQSVIDLGQRAGIEAMNEKCLDLMKRKKGSTSKAGCEYLPAPDETGQLKMLDYRDNVLAHVHDIEDAVKIGKEMHVCPYFGARGSVRQAHIVTMPYNLLLNATARASLNMELNGAIVIIDEAHNLIDTILATHTVIVSASQIQTAMGQINDYLEKFSSRLKGTNEINLQILLMTLRSLEALDSKAQSMTPAELMRKIGGNIDQINLLELDRWLRETKIARKIAGYADRKLRVEVDSEKLMQRATQSGISALHTIESFLLALTNRDLDGRIYFSTAAEFAKNGHLEQNKKQWSLKYQLLNPSEVFSEIVKDSRSVILAGGTMEPISDFAMQLFPTFDQSKI